MAMMLDAFLNNFSTLLTEMVKEEVGMLCGVPGEIEKLGRTVGDIQCLLSDAERKKTESQSIERWLLELKDAMYDADDIIDLCQIKAEERSERHDGSSSKFGCGLSMLSCIRNPVFAHKVGTQIKELNSRLNEIYKRSSTLGLTESRAMVGQSNVTRQHSDFSSKTDPSIVLADIVGDKIEEDTTMLVDLLTTEEEGLTESVSAIAIVGMAGIGKTTLAKKIFNDPEIQREFSLKLWVCVSKDLKGLELLKCAIREAGGDHGAAEDKAELVPLLAKLIQGKKFFLVLDDVWPESEKVWNELLRDAMIGGACGSRLLVTTRNDRVACFFQPTMTHHVQKLSDEDAWSLLAKQVALNKSDSESLKDIGLELVEKCDGLPLAIKTIGGVLRGRGKNIDEWQIISKSNLWSLDDLSSDFPHAFYLSYEDLPSHLKQCFIFCSLYPGNFVFEKLNLVYLWLAEGFLCDKGDLSFYEMGIEYHKELVWRNLLEVDKNYYGQPLCKMHDLLRSFARDKGNGDSLIMRERESVRRRESFLKLRRLSIENSAVDLDLDFINEGKSLRTLLLVDRIDPLSSNSLLSFSHLRILDFFNSNISRLSGSVGGLVQLRYLNASGTNLKTLPNSIGNLRKLVYLNFDECNKLSHVPSSIVNLVELRFLSFYGTNIKVFPAGLKKLKKLIHLYNFQPGHNRSQDYNSSSLEDLGTLSLLSMLTLGNLENVTDINVAKEANLKEKAHLKELWFCYKPNRGYQVSKSIEEKKVVEDVLNELSPPPSLEILQIVCYFGDRLPNWLHAGANPLLLKFLRYLKIEQCECFSQLPPLGLLPNLDTLSIIGAESVVRIGREFLFDDSLSHSPILPFSQLTDLGFRDMPSWVEWLWDERQPAMPKLKELYIYECPKLSSLPQGLLCHATSLEVLQIKAVEQLKSVEDLRSVKELYVEESSNLERISNLPNLSFIQIVNCPNIKILQNLKPRYRMFLIDYEMETLPEYLRKAEVEKLTVWCTEELLVMIASLEIGTSEWQKFEYIPRVKFYGGDDESLYATYQRTPFRFTTNVDSSALSLEED
ncbi:NBS-LRR-like resistance protein [Rhynchospora pubera]|uniref:NBS-LRR-like resistance protein n=1 Tax=Rhynchospora pubera TaxID=906938 RepID=A0AAV8GR62_9POAL|nr:NBS-LRR-like resistance protein [Rhynchospora pubera]